MNPNEKNKIHYIERLNKVFDYIDENIDAQLNLDDLAKVSHFSKFHFSRIFSALVGETPFKFIQRIRLERANHASLLCTSTSHPPHLKNKTYNRAIFIKLLLSKPNTFVPNLKFIEIWNS